MLYTTVKHLHLTLVTCTILLFLFRAGLMLWSPKHLQKRWLKVLPHVIDTFLLLSGVGLMFIVGQYPLVNSWLTAKILGVLAYIGFGAVALKRGRSRKARLNALGLALLSLGYVVAVAHTHSPTLHLF